MFTRFKGWAPRWRHTKVKQKVERGRAGSSCASEGARASGPLSTAAIETRETAEGVARRSIAPGWPASPTSNFRGGLPLDPSTDSESTDNQNIISFWVPCSEHMAGRAPQATCLRRPEPRTPLEFDTREDLWCPNEQWTPPDWSRLDSKYGAGYPEVWWVESHTNKPQRPYLLRLDLARVQPESFRPPEEMFEVRRLLDEEPPPETDFRLELPSLERPMERDPSLAVVHEAVVGFGTRPKGNCEEAPGRRWSSSQGIRVPLAGALLNECDSLET